MIKFDKKLFEKYARIVFGCDSPIGFTDNCAKVVGGLLEEIGYDYKVLDNGAIEVFVEGNDHSKLVATSAHIDTLGLMVRSIKPNGMLALTGLGGIVSPTIDGEYCNIYTRDGKVYTGTIQSNVPAAHVFDDAKTKERSIENLEVRIDERVESKDDALKLGIQNGDFVAYETKFEITKSGFVKTRFIDDKASVVILLMLLDYMKKNNLKFKYDTKLYFIVYEELGFGACMVDPKINEYVTLDMGCIGADLSGSEYAVSICAKDAAGPYDYELTTRLINLAKKHKLNYSVDIYPRYSSDVSAARRAGVDCKGALIGMGVYASHGMERTHFDGLENTLKLTYLYFVGEE